MAFYDSINLEKGMYNGNDKSFSKVLESLDPSTNYAGTDLNSLDAFERQLKRFDIKVKGYNSDSVSKFFKLHSLVFCSLNMLNVALFKVLTTQAY